MGDFHFNPLIDEFRSIEKASESILREYQRTTEQNRSLLMHSSLSKHDAAALSESMVRSTIGTSVQGDTNALPTQILIDGDSIPEQESASKLVALSQTSKLKSLRSVTQDGTYMRVRTRNAAGSALTDTAKRPKAKSNTRRYQQRQ